MTSKRSTAETEATNDLAKSIEELLVDVHDESLDLEREGTETVSRTMARFASILVVLSRQAKEESDRNLKMQKTIRNLTWALLVLTFVLAVPPVISVIEKCVETAPSTEPAGP